MAICIHRLHLPVEEVAEVWLPLEAAISAAKSRSLNSSRASFHCEIFLPQSFRVEDRSDSHCLLVEFTAATVAGIGIVLAKFDSEILFYLGWFLICCSLSLLSDLAAYQRGLSHNHSL